MPPDSFVWNFELSGFARDHGLLREVFLSLPKAVKSMQESKQPKEGNVLAQVGISIDESRDAFTLAFIGRQYQFQFHTVIQRVSSCTSAVGKITVLRKFVAASPGAEGCNIGTYTFDVDGFLEGGGKISNTLQIFSFLMKVLYNDLNPSSTVGVS